MRWSGQELAAEQPSALPGLAKLSNFVRSVKTPEFAGITFHEVLAKSALNHVPGSSNAMPFGWTINPYRGCSHACAYCLGPETLILMADGRQKPLWDVRVGDEIYGTEVRGAYRRYVRTTVHATWSTRKPGYRVSLADGTEIVASGDHRFLSNRGWKHVTGAMSGPATRPYLTRRNKLMGFGATGLRESEQPQYFAADYRRGYLCGMIRGDAHIGHHPYIRSSGRPGVVHQFRLALADEEVLNRSRLYLDQEGVATTTFDFSVKTDVRRAMKGIRVASRAAVERIEGIIAWTSQASNEWHAGFLAGVFDAEGSCSGGVLRISNKKEEMLAQIAESLDELAIDYTREPANSIGVANIRITGGLAMRQRFFRLTGPAISRKLNMDGLAVKSNARLEVVSIEDLGEVMDMIDITTGTGDFIANGVISHNCFARPTHRYLELDAGKDFDSEIIVKVNVAEVLAKELAKPSWAKHPVALGTNTDPYQRAEGRYRLMPGIIAALADSGTPFSILTKGTLLRRDLPLLAEASELVPVDLAMSIAIYDDELQQSVEPGTPSTAARLATVTAAKEHGLGCSVFMMPILPYLTDTRAHLDTALRQIRDAGADSVLYTALHLRPGVKEWFMLWLADAHPELVPRYRELYAGGAYAPKEYRKWLAAKIKPLIRSHGLERGRADPATGAVRSSALGRGSARVDGGSAPRSLIAEELPAGPGLSSTPTLF
ncbi:intein-containing Rv2578c family radical SAM protein [Parafrigoribacterium soli]|uniref:intein-containing Rv2578c family radical SAM protein n=1 Tax=Parafrigoribacterium soli TaxID=3144663 RepID=UPI0032EB67B3